MLDYLCADVNVTEVLSTTNGRIFQAFAAANIHISLPLRKKHNYNRFANSQQIFLQ
jgi:phenylalanyl-tRNA synthetase beta subunit